MVKGDVQDARIKALERALNLVHEGELDDAWPIIDRALRDEPNDARALLLASDLHDRIGRHSIAYQLAVRAAQLQPNMAETWNNVGVQADELWRFDEAAKAYRKAIQLARSDEHRSMFSVNLGALLVNNGEFVKAEPVLREALRLNPESIKGKANLGFSELAQQRWATAWHNYHASLGINATRKKIQYGDEPEWDGTPGRVVAIYGEQGLGDEISFASMLPDAIRDCKRVIVDCEPRLTNLFRRSFPGAKVYGTLRQKSVNWAAEDTQIDCSAAAASLGMFYRTSAADFPGTPYLTPCPDRTLMWKALFKAKKKPVIGIAWTGGIEKTGAKFRRLTLPQMRPIFDAVDAHFVCLQYKDATREIEDSGAPVTQYPFATLSKDYDDTAALVAACDLVITMQTSVVHLAGALGVPCWTMVSATGQWRYGVEGDSLPWYRSVRLFRASEPGKWEPVVQKIAHELRGWHAVYEH